MADPNLASQQAAASAVNVSELQNQAQMDTAAMMARYGTRLAIANVVSPSSPGAKV